MNIYSDAVQKIAELTQKLIQFQTITPIDNGCLAYIAEKLQNLGFEIQYHNKENIINLYAKKIPNPDEPTFCFAGHTDVVPTGSGWTHPPFEGKIVNNILYGRGTSDMKCAIACFMHALETSDLSDKNVCVLLTSDEEADAIHGLRTTTEMLKKENISLFLLGEPTSLKSGGDCVKIGRRGSVTGVIKCHGQQGHIAYPEFFENPLTTVMHTYSKLQAELDTTDIFPFGPSRIEVTDIQGNSDAENVVPGEASLRFGIRFNPTYNIHTLKDFITGVCQKYAKKHDLKISMHGNSFSTNDPKIINLIKKSISEDVVLDAKGAVSDGRFLSEVAPVIECGFMENQAHQVDENVKLEDIEKIYTIYKNFLTNFTSYLK